MSNEPTVKRWTAKRKAAMVMDVFKGKITIAEVLASMTSPSLRSKAGLMKPSAAWRTGSGPAPRISASSMSPSCGKPRRRWARPICRSTHKKVSPPARRGRELVRSLQAELAHEGHVVSLSKLCQWLGLPRRTVYYRPKPRPRVINADLAASVKLALERFPTYSYRRLACVLSENRKPIQRILQLKGWQVRKRPQGFRPRARSLPSVASRPDERWATDLTHVWCGEDRRASLVVIIDCCTREVLGWQLSDNGSSKTAEAALVRSPGAQVPRTGPYSSTAGLAHR
ncbi:DDE-type integrase/transposase/recombinase [Halomonas sp. V046]|uniref:DDE-type integrase/transposase/recombinase n=1 Tax=Halomonas sp. V046 TaxID=3459611 RepID=UPI004043CE8C